MYEIKYRKRRYTKSEEKTVYIQASNSTDAKEKIYKLIGQGYIITSATKMK